MKFTADFLLLLCAALQVVTSGPDLLVRKYHEGDKIFYHMKATNRGGLNSLSYEIQAEGQVKKDGEEFFEEIAWNHLSVNGKPLELPEASKNFRQVVSLVPDPKYVRLPDLSKVHPLLIGPITDLLTFYADMMVAHSHKLVRTGDHFYLQHGTPASWADGYRVTLGEDSIDFDVTLTNLDLANRSAIVTVRHVPPRQPQIKIPADWMRTPVSDTPNNWVQVSKSKDGKYLAQTGKETFTADITISLDDGRILSATMENPVDAIGRECEDVALQNCGEAKPYHIRREIHIN
jgi:hypothetical protein